MRRRMMAVLAVAGLFSLPARAETICTVVADAKSKAIVQEGDCKRRVTPASTFKIALAVMGFDSGFLKSEHDPVLTFEEGDPAWGGAEWKAPTDAERWMHYSVVWFSQRITHFIGAGKLAAYARSFDYGNADISGDKGARNGLDRAWISSSLKISPLEQIAFLKKLVNGTLPVHPDSIEKTKAVLEEIRRDDGWVVKGKTGMAYPRLADGRFDRAHPFGWYVGYAENGDRRVVLARLVQEDGPQPGSASHRARDALLNDLQGLVDRLGQ
ncbi:class D beta-lactamase [Rhizobium sp. SSA_523]|uniref:class D beta-lactamase n=1 Tax=Rhizobium sp. SSA_523 TaxID=2952477 RepID=UPI0020906DC4|nr:class D beta-lactamase [Rhizobium sp. SSA_523]MCO5733521.1 class D beta-lactamase [Rhizobium sp. SSA_523]WKC23175.1 class D beta-lactamase [Rhizobium sp. SSA_523]